MMARESGSSRRKTHTAQVENHAGFCSALCTELTVSRMRLCIARPRGQRRPNITEEDKVYGERDGVSRKWANFLWRKERSPAILQPRWLKPHNSSSGSNKVRRQSWRGEMDFAAFLLVALRYILWCSKLEVSSLPSSCLLPLKLQRPCFGYGRRQYCSCPSHG